MHACSCITHCARSGAGQPVRSTTGLPPPPCDGFFSSGIHTPQGANARLTNTSKRRALHYHKGNVEIINALLKHTTDVDAQVLIGVQHAVQQNLMFNLAEMTDRRVSWLVSHPQDSAGSTALSRAAALGQLPAARALLAAGASLDIKDKFGTNIVTQQRACVFAGLQILAHIVMTLPGNAPLHRACDENRAPMAVLLVENGANVSTRNAELKSPLQLANKGLRATLDSLRKELD